MDIPNEPLRQRAHTMSDMRHLTGKTSPNNSPSHRRESEELSTSLPLMSFFGYFRHGSRSPSLHGSVESDVGLGCSDEKETGRNVLKETGNENIDLQNIQFPEHHLVANIVIPEVNETQNSIDNGMDTTSQYAENIRNVGLFSKFYDMFHSQKPVCGAKDKTDGKDSQLIQQVRHFQPQDCNKRVTISRRDINFIAPQSL